MRYNLYMPAVQRSFRIRAYPNPAQIRMLNQWFGASRWLWNWALESRTKAYQRRKQSITGIDISRRLTKLKKLPRFAWLAKVPATCLTQTLRDQDSAFSHFFRSIKAGETPGYPRFRSRYNNAVSLRFQDVSEAKWAQGIVSLTKLGPVKLAAVANQRNYALHAITTRLVSEHQIICIEGLAVQNMIKHPRLAQYIADAGWGEFRRMIEYKAKWYGRTVIVVDRWFPSSKTCGKCKHVMDELRLDQREWTCPKCGTVHDRDINAAQNLLLAGMSELGGGERRDLGVDGAVVNAPREAPPGQIN